jgi:GNAT superfamily N-acetyltransferase
MIPLSIKQGKNDYNLVAMTATLQLRTATPSDIGVMTRLVNTAFAVERFFIEGERISLDEIRLRFETGTFLIAELDGRCSGVVYVELRGERGYIGLLSVNPERQGRGIGRQLMSAAEEHCRASGCLAVDLQIVNLRDELPAFYARLGYVENGTLPFPSGVATKLPCHFIRMSKLL